MGRNGVAISEGKVIQAKLWEEECCVEGEANYSADESDGKGEDRQSGSGVSIG